MSANQEILKLLLARGEYLDRFGDKETARVLAILERAHDEILGKIARTKGPWTREWLSAMKADIDAIYGEAAAKIGARLDKDLEPLAVKELEWTASSLEKVTVGVSITSPSPAGLYASIASLPAADGSTLANLLEGLALGSSARVTEAIQLGMTEGETVKQMTRRILEELDVTRSQAESIARTAAMHVGNQAREALYDANRDLVKGYQRVETLDADTCIVCGADDGHVYGMDEARPSLPAHPRCRGIYVPVLKSWREIGINRDEIPASTRASMDGQVAENETFEDRLKRLTPVKQDTILGPSRGKLYRGGLPLKDMVDDGRLVPLAELGKRKRSAA